MGNERLLEGQPVERGGTVHLQLKSTGELQLFCQELHDFEERNFLGVSWLLLKVWFAKLRYCHSQFHKDSGKPPVASIFILFCVGLIERINRFPY